MNKLNSERQAQIVKALCEGNSIRSTARMTGSAINTVVKLLTELGAACAEYHNNTMWKLPCKRIQCDEIWSFCYSKQKNVPEEHQGEFGYGDVWTWTAIDADTKLIPAWFVGLRNAECASAFLNDLAERLTTKHIQLTTDGHKVYLDAVESAFAGNVDYAMLVKLYGNERQSEARYSPAECTGTEIKVIQGNPKIDHISTSYVERQNLTMRMSMRRFTRLTNAFSKKIENHEAAIALYFMHYNFARPHKSLANPYPRTPAMAVGIADHVWTVEEIVGLLSK
ncbi:DDE-type integrase/transposase/recombinase [bacterium]|nr:DDE-type integrase/transposase/recombinase [bacterium]